MIKNTQDLSIALFIFVTATLYPKAEITIPNLAPGSIQELHTFSKNHPEGFTIHLVPQKEWGELIAGFINAPFIALRNSISLKNITLTLVSGALSLGWISYLLCTYLIYKTYLVVKNVHSWVNWCSDDDLLSDYDALYQKFDQYKRSCTSTKKPFFKPMKLHEEKALLKAYLQLDAVLKTHNIRHHFPYADARTHKMIERGYVKLKKAEKLLTARNAKTKMCRDLKT